MTRPVRLSNLAALDLQQARDWFDRREDGLGDRFLESIEDALERISLRGAIPGGAARTAPRAREGLASFALVSRLPDESIVVAALSDRRDLSLAPVARSGGGADVTKLGCYDPAEIY